MQHNHYIIVVKEKVELNKVHSRLTYHLLWFLEYTTTNEDSQFSNQDQIQKCPLLYCMYNYF